MGAIKHLQVNWTTVVIKVKYKIGGNDQSIKKKLQKPGSTKTEVCCWPVRSAINRWKIIIKSNCRSPPSTAVLPYNYQDSGLLDLALDAECFEDLRIFRVVGRLLLPVGEHGGCSARPHHQAATVLIAVPFQVATQVHRLPGSENIGVSFLTRYKIPVSRIRIRYFFGLPGSRSVIICLGSESFLF